VPQSFSARPRDLSPQVRPHLKSSCQLVPRARRHVAGGLVRGCLQARLEAELDYRSLFPQNHLFADAVHPPQWNARRHAQEHRQSPRLSPSGLQWPAVLLLHFVHPAISNLQPNTKQALCFGGLSKRHCIQPSCERLPRTPWVTPVCNFAMTSALTERPHGHVGAMTARRNDAPR